MDAYAWTLFIGFTAAVGAVMVGLIGIILQGQNDMNAILTANADLDRQLNEQHQKQIGQIELEREIQYLLECE